MTDLEELNIFEQQIREARKRAAILRERALGSGLLNEQTVMEAFEEFLVTLEELNVAYAELHQQTEELIETRTEVEAERARYQDLFEFAPNGYLVTDMNGIIREANQAAVALLGTTQKYLRGKPIIVFVSEDRKRDVRSFLLGLEDQDQEREWEIRLRPRVGETFFCAVTVTTMRNRDGSAYALRWLLRDITPQKRADAQIRLLNEELEQRIVRRTADLARSNQMKDELLLREQANLVILETAQADLRFLSEASAVLAESLDYATTLARIARLVVSYLSDWCVITMAEEDGSLRTMAVAHADPAKVEWAYEMQNRYPPRPELNYGPAHVIRTGKSEYHLEITDSMLQHVAMDKEHLQILRKLGLASYMIVPLKTPTQTLGAITIVSSRSERRYGQADVTVAEELARRAALAVENARLYRQAQREVEERKRAEQQVADLNARLIRSMSETHHRVKNNLQIIKAMMDMQLMDAGETVPVSEVQRLSRQITLLACVHELLTKQEVEGESKLILPAGEILETILTMMQQGVGIRPLKYALAEINLPVRQATSLALVLNELISNAYKHSQGEIEVTLKVATEAEKESFGWKRKDGQAALLEVCDDGAGFPDGFHPMTYAHTGLELVESLSRWDMSGQTCYENRPEGGARIRIFFPLG